MKFLLLALTILTQCAWQFPSGWQNDFPWQNSSDGSGNIVSKPSSANVGIGTTGSVPNKLYVVGDIFATGSINGGSGVVGPWTVSGNNLYPTNISNNVGIGSSNPASKLDVNGTITSFGLKSTFSDVIAYGAKGDGVTDDTTAIQAAITATAGKSVLYFQKPSVKYLITSQITIPSNTVIIGENSQIYMASQANEAATANMFATNPAVTTSNIFIQGLYLQSVNDKAGTGYFTGATTSYVQGIFIQNTSNVTLKDITMDAMSTALKIGTATNTHVLVDNFKATNSGTDLLVSYVDDLRLSRLYLDSTGFLSTDGHLHNIYFSTNVANVFMDNLNLNNTAGSCIQLYQSGGVAASNVQGKNIICTQALSTSFYVYGGATDVKYDGVTATQVPSLLNIDDAHNVQISHVFVKPTNSLIVGGSNTSNHITIDHAQVDGSTIVTKDGVISMVVADDINLLNCDIYSLPVSELFLFNGSSSGNLTNFTIKGNKINYAVSPSNQIISVRHVGSTNILFQNNTFTNSGVAFADINNNQTGILGDVNFNNNTVTGWNAITHASSDTSTLDSNNILNNTFVNSTVHNSNVGIGTVSPNGILDVEGTLYPMVFNGLKNSNNNVGIGSFHPGYTLDVQGSIRSSAFVAGQALCSMADKSIGQCTTVVGAGGACTCTH